MRKNLRYHQQPSLLSNAAPELQTKSAAANAVTIEYLTQGLQDEL